MRIFKPKKEKKAKPISKKRLESLEQSARKALAKAEAKRNEPKNKRWTGWEYKDRFSYRKIND